MTGRGSGRDFARHLHRLIPDGVRGDVFDFDRASSELLGITVKKMREAASYFNGPYRLQTVVSYT
jgi:hypothetical protein